MPLGAKIHCERDLCKSVDDVFWSRTPAAELLVSQSGFDPVGYDFTSLEEPHN